MGKFKTHEKYVAEVAIKNPNVEVVGTYVDAKTPILHRCKIDGHEWSVSPTNILSGKGCPECARRKSHDSFAKTQEQYIVEVAMVNPDIEVVGIYINYHTKILHRCKVDGTEWMVEPSVILRGGTCPTCGDGVPYPEKLMANILMQLNVLFKPQYSPRWIKPRRYDFYFEHKNQKYIIETDGGIGHGNDCKSIGVSGEKSKEIDEYKDKMASEHDIIVIRIDCDYRYYDRLEYIKSNIMHSNLSELFDLNDIDWVYCDKAAQRSLFIYACELWNNGVKNHYEIAKIVSLHPTSITTYLKRSQNLQMTDYNHDEYRKIAIKMSREKSSLTQSSPVR